ncbi:MAG: hypothetical protein ACRELB_20695, partial [Polyangiaceae bacterium]
MGHDRKLGASHPYDLNAETEDLTRLERFVHPCFDLKSKSSGGRLATPANLSAGFHQVAPIVAQMGLMKRHELLMVE